MVSHLHGSCRRLWLGLCLQFHPRLSLPSRQTCMQVCLSASDAEACLLAADADSSYHAHDLPGLEIFHIISLAHTPRYIKGYRMHPPCYPPWPRQEVQACRWCWAQLHLQLQAQQDLLLLQELWQGRPWLQQPCVELADAPSALHSSAGGHLQSVTNHIEVSFSLIQDLSSHP